MRRRIVFLVGPVAGLALVLVMRHVSAPRPHGESANLVAPTLASSEPPSAPHGQEATTPPVARAPLQVGALGSASPPALSSLKMVLAADDDVAKIDALDGAVRARDTAELPTLLAVDLAREPEAAPTIIHAVASLANAADVDARRASVAVLGRWLAEESLRHDPDAVGNVPNLVEALGTIGGADATATLIAALEKGQLDLSVETLLVQSLGHARDGRALEPVKRFVDRVAAIPPVDGIQEELRVEAIAAGNSAISSIQGG